MRTSDDPARFSPVLRSRIESLGREYPLSIETVNEEYDFALQPERMFAILTSVFGALGLLLAAIGLYGLLSYSVSRRKNEIGLRVALGATRRSIALLILREIATLLAIGLVLGLGISFVVTRLTAAYLHGLSGHNPEILAVSAGVLILVACLASFLPAMKAVRTDPGKVLRY